jgi:viroplasmin and RNaseH domain-containing protein
VIRNVYGDSTLDQMLKPPKKEDTRHYSYTVPVRWIKGSYQVNWPLVKKVLGYIKSRLMDLYMVTERHIVCAKYNLEELAKKDTTTMLGKVWDNKFIGNRHVVVDYEQAWKAWDKPLELTQGKQSDLKHYKQKINQER